MNESVNIIENYFYRQDAQQRFINMQEEIRIDECRQLINDNFVSKLLGYLRGDSLKVSTNEEYMKVYQLIIFQCDTNDNNEQIYNIFEYFVAQYLDGEIGPMLRPLQGERLLTSLCKVWAGYVIYSKMMDRTFEYLNRYYLKNN